MEEQQGGQTAAGPVAEGLGRSGQEDWYAQSAPIALQTRGKQKQLDEDPNLFEVERIEKDMMKNGVSITCSFL
jgi:hypothetical protein